MNKDPESPPSALQTVKHHISTGQFDAKLESTAVSNPETYHQLDTLYTAEEQRTNRVIVEGPSTAASTSLLPRKRSPESDTVPPAKRHTPSESSPNVAHWSTSDTQVNKSDSSSNPCPVQSSPTLPVVKPAGIVLSSEQKQIIKLANEGRSFFYTGCAGRSYLSDQHQ